MYFLLFYVILLASSRRVRRKIRSTDFAEKQFFQRLYTTRSYNKSLVYKKESKEYDR